MPDRFDMSDYVPVNERLDALLKRYPDASVQSEIVELTESRVTVKAYAYRTPDDARPGIGHSSLEIPGKTPYTRGSEIENAETSAWGRAIAALGFEVKRGLASAEEVRNKQPQGGERVPLSRREASPQPATTRLAAQRTPVEEGLREELLALTASKGHEYMTQLADKVGVPKGQRANVAQLSAMIDYALDAAGNDAAAEHAATEGPAAGQLSGPSIQPATAGDAEAAGVSPPPAASPRTVEEAIADAEKKAKATT